MSYKLGIIGSRVWTSRAGQIWNPKITNPREFVFNHMDQYVAKYGKPSKVYSGGAKGADKYGVEWAESRGIKFKEYRPDGPESAEVLMNEGYIPALFHRNKLVVKASDRIVAFWDKKSRGTLDTLTKAKTAKKQINVFNVG
jgi:hypothetical protein|tara:strand:+ start:83 stop:505 length:423 start_codon:yes stop_codon:yes gene_type:complete